MQKSKRPATLTDKSIAKQIGAAVRSLRRRGKLSQESLADNSGIHVTYLSGLERGRRNPTVRVLNRIAAGLGVPLSQLISESEQTSRGRK